MKSSLQAAIAPIANVTQWDYWDAEVFPEAGGVGRVMLASVSRSRGVTRHVHRVALAYTSNSLEELYAQVYPVVNELLQKFSQEQAPCVGGAVATIDEIHIGEPSGYQPEDYASSLTQVKLWVAFEVKSEG